MCVDFLRGVAPMNRGGSKTKLFVTHHNDPEDLTVIVLPVYFNVNQHKNEQTVKSCYRRLSRRHVVVHHERNVHRFR